MYNFIKCAESCSRAPLASERSAIAQYILRALSTGIDMELLSDLFITELRHLAPRGSKKLRLDYFNSGCLTVQNKFASDHSVIYFWRGISWPSLFINFSKVSNFAQRRDEKRFHAGPITVPLGNYR